jgi:hypothetical protein
LAVNLVVKFGKSAPAQLSWSLVLWRYQATMLSAATRQCRTWTPPAQCAYRTFRVPVSNATTRILRGSRCRGRRGPSVPSRAGVGPDLLPKATPSRTRTSSYTRSP